MKSIEEKAQKYNEALERAKGVIEQNPLMEYLKKGIEYILPELKESDDERIRKGIIRNLEYLMDRAEGFVKDELKERIAWLEKQGEHKPAWSEEDERYINIAVSAFSSPSLERLYQYNKVKSNDLINWLNSIKDKILHQKQWKPSDEQLKALKEACDEHWESDGLDPLYTLCEQLKKLREE